MVKKALINISRLAARQISSAPVNTSRPLRASFILWVRSVIQQRLQARQIRTTIWVISYLTRAATQEQTRHQVRESSSRTEIREDFPIIVTRSLNFHHRTVTSQLPSTMNSSKMRVSKPHWAVRIMITPQVEITIRATRVVV